MSNDNKSTIESRAVATTKNEPDHRVDFNIKIRNPSFAVKQDTSLLLNTSSNTIGRSGSKPRPTTADLKQRLFTPVLGRKLNEDSLI